MELAKVTTNGRITIPAGARKKLGMKDGDIVLFLEEDGRVVMEKHTDRTALREAQRAFAVKNNGILPLSGHKIT